MSEALSRFFHIQAFIAFQHLFLYPGIFMPRAFWPEDLRMFLKRLYLENQGENQGTERGLFPAIGMPMSVVVWLPVLKRFLRRESLKTCLSSICGKRI